MSLQSIAIFCGSKPGLNPLFEKDTIALGHILAQNNVTVINGGGNKGLMATIANAVLEKKGNVIGIIPELLRAQEHVHTTLTELHLVESMHIRKKMLYEKCDAAIILPGGYGTLDEVFEMLTWNQLNIHSKKIFFLNSGGFYKHLLEHIRVMYEQKFLYSHPDTMFTTLNEPGEIINYL